MADDTATSASPVAYATGRRPTSPPTAAGTGNAPPAPPGFSMRRAVTIDPGAQQQMRRRRPTLDTSPSGGGGGGGGGGGNEQIGLLAGIRRGSSSFSDYSINDARKELGASAEDLLNLNPSGTASSPSSHTRQASHYLPIVFALLPALAGIFFDNGASFFTDLILLSLAAVVLHWSVTQPWDWYLETQQVRVVSGEDNEFVSSPVLDTDSDLEPAGSPSVTAAPKRLDEIAENAELTGEENPDNGKVENEKQKPTQSEKRSPRRRMAGGRWEARRTAAAKELRIHEILALTWCFAFPVLGSYLLHTLRGQLSRPSEGLVSDYNLTIFLCAAELRPVSHLIKMVRSRTLRMQRLVSSNPYDPNPTTAAAAVSAESFAALSSRLNDLEARAAAASVSGEAAPGNDKVGGEGGFSTASDSKMNQAARVREINSTMQPEMDAMNRAMRRYEKKLAVLAGQMDGRLEYIDRRLQDAVALAAVAAKNSSSNSNKGSSLFAWLFEWIAAVLMLPVHAVVAVFTFPFRTASALLRGNSSSSSSSKHTHEKARGNRGNRDRGAAVGAAASGHGGSRDAPDRIPSRLSRR